MKKTMLASIHIQIEETGEVTMHTNGEDLALELANEMVNMAINGGIDGFIGEEIQCLQ